MWVLYSVVLAIMWFGFADRPFPSYLRRLSAVVSGESCKGELVYADQPRALSSPFVAPRCIRVFDPGYRTVYRYEIDGVIRYVTVWFDYDMPVPIPSSIELAYFPKRPAKVYPMHGGAIIRGFKGFRYYLYYIIPVMILVLGFFLQCVCI